MPAQPCARHPKVMTYVRCGHCDKPICVDCMVDSPVGKKCRDCARSRTHLLESSPLQVLGAFVLATLAAVPAAWAMHLIPIFYIVPVIYGAVVGEAALVGGKRSRSPAIQAAAGLAAVLGGVVGYGIWIMPRLGGGLPASAWLMLLGYPLVMTVLGAAVAVSRVRFL